MTLRASVSIRKYTELCSKFFQLDCQQQQVCGNRKCCICFQPFSVGFIFSPSRRCIDIVNWHILHRVLHHLPLLTMELETSASIDT